MNPSSFPAAAASSLLNPILSRKQIKNGKKAQTVTKVDK
jgi:hypothetical protein